MARATPTIRDDFTQATKTVIARRTNYHCSICLCTTAGPAENPQKAKSIGVAAHITAASPGGPRYDASLTSEDRKSAANGIWCCQNCAKEIDDDDSKFTAEQLHEKRRHAEKLADERIGIRTERGPELAHAERAARSAAATILERWQSTYLSNQQQLVELDLRERADPADPTTTPTIWSLAQVVDALSDGRALVVLGRPGAGKTITLLQAAERLLDEATAPIPLVFPISGWVASGCDLAKYVTERLTGLGVAPAGVPFLLKTCRLALLLNGWNEAEEVGQTRANAQLRDFVLNHPGTPLAITSRETRSPPAVPGGTLLDVRPLSPTKKADVVQAAALADPDRFLAELRNNPRLADVTDTPLFLAAALRLARTGQPIPATRSGLLNSFVAELERTDNHAEMLHDAPCYGLHRAYLAAAASAMTKQARTTLPAAAMHNALAECSHALVDQHHLGMPAASPAIVESLVRHHVLVLLPETETTYAFVHQQFQEWFAAQLLEQRVRDVGAAPAAVDLFAFQRDVLNQPQWGEALDFTLENLTAASELALAAQLVRWMMPVDLVVAAELSYVGGVAVWALVRGELSEVLRAWHGRGVGAHRDCALVAMLATGQPDFADLFWPELEGDDQDLMRLCRLYAPVRTSSLGPGWQARVAGWAERQQECFLGELSRSAGRDELEFAETRAAAGSASVRIAALDLLLEQSAFTRIVRIITAPGFGEWPAELYDRILCRLPRASVRPLVAELAERLRTATALTTRRGIINALRRAGEPTWVAAAQAEMDLALAAWRAGPAPADTPDDRQRAHESVGILASYAAMLQPSAGDWLARWLARNLGQSLLWDQRFIAYVESFPESLLVTLAQTAFSDPSEPFHIRERVRALTGGGSAAVVGVMLDTYLAALNSRDDGGIDSHFQALEIALRELPAGVIIDGLLAKAATITQFAQLKALVGLVSPASRLDGNLKEALQPSQRDRLRALICQVSGLIPHDDEARSLRPSLAIMLGALGHADDVPLVARWVATEQACWEAYCHDLIGANTPDQRRRIGQYGTNWWSSYRAALALFQCPPAEQLLFEWLNSPHLIAEGASGLVEFSVLERSLPALPSELALHVPALRALPLVPMHSHVRTRADAIVAALERFERAQTDGPIQGRQLTEAAVALAMLNDPRSIERLLRLDATQAGWRLIDSFRAMALRGTVVPGRRLAAALEPFLAESEARHYGANADHWYAVVKGLAILLASDEPLVAIERMRLIPVQRIQSYGVRYLFELISSSARSEAGSYLVELSHTMDQSAPYFPDLIEALARSSDPVCHARVLELMLQGTHAWPASVWEALEYAGADLAKSDAAFRAELLGRVRDTDGEVGILLARVVGTIDSEDAAVALLARADLRPLESVLERQLGELTETKTPVGQGNAYYLVPRDATELKRCLAALLVPGTPNCVVASRLLASVRVKRVEYGQPSHEPLHPDIEQLRGPGMPWPLLS